MEFFFQNYGEIYEFRIFKVVFVLQKRAVGFITCLKIKHVSCTNAFKTLGVLTFPCIYVLEMLLYLILIMSRIWTYTINYSTMQACGYCAKPRLTVVYTALAI